jgi:hypothetical protein
MVALVSDEPVADPSADYSILAFCWFSDDLATPLPKLIAREVFDVEWNRHARDGWT